MKHPIDWKFAALSVFVFGGSVGGWMSILRELRAVPDAVAEPIPEIAPETAQTGAWEPIGTDSQGREFLKRAAQNGDVERLTILQDGTGLYVRCPQPDPFPNVEGCAKIVLRPGR